MRSERKFNTVLGFYMPSMFHLHVHTINDFSRWKEWDDTTLCTFLHEYIHFLQDISTVSGLYNIYVLGECLADHVNKIYSMPDGTVNVPLEILPDVNNVLNNKELSELLEGEIEINGIDACSFQVTGRAEFSENFLKYNGQVLSVPKVYVPYDGGGCFLLGNYHISESMAYLGEMIVYGNASGVVEPSPNYPYDVVRQLASFYSSQLASNIPLLFSLCDLSLTFSHSGKALIGFFIIYVDKGCPSDWQSFVVDLRNNLKVVGLNSVSSYSDGLCQIRDLAIQSLDKRFNHFTYDDIRRWYYNIICRAIEMRLQNPLFIYDFLSGGELKHNKWFEHLLKGIGTPVISNDLYNSFFTTKVNGCALKKRRAEFLIAAGSITYALGYGYFPCELRKICRAENRCIDKNCVRAPWKHARKVSPCPYGHLWYGWALKNKELES